MFIDTTTANTHPSRPHIALSPRNSSPYNDSQTPLLETFVGQDAPPTYLEATTPGLYETRLSGEEGARLLSFDGREARDARGKEDKYRRRSLREKCLKKKWARWIAGVVLVGVLAALGAAALAAKRDTQVGDGTMYF